MSFSFFSFEAVVACALLENNSAKQSQDFVTEQAAIVKIRQCNGLCTGPGSTGPK